MTHTIRARKSLSSYRFLRQVFILILLGIQFGNTFGQSFGIYHRIEKLRRYGVVTTFMDKNGWLLIGTDNCVVRYNGKDVEEFFMPDKKRYGRIVYSISDSSIYIVNSNDSICVLQNEEIVPIRRRWSDSAVWWQVYQLPDQFKYYPAVFDIRTYSTIHNTFLTKDNQVYYIPDKGDSLIWGNHLTTERYKLPFKRGNTFLIGLDSFILCITPSEKRIEEFKNGRKINAQNTISSSLMHLLLTTLQNNKVAYDQNQVPFYYSNHKLYRISPHKPLYYDTDLLSDALGEAPEIICKLPDDQYFINTHIEGAGILRKKQFNFLYHLSIKAPQNAYPEKRSTFINHEGKIIDQHWGHIGDKRFWQTSIQADMGSNTLCMDSQYLYYCKYKGHYLTTLIKENMYTREVYEFPFIIDFTIRCLLLDTPGQQILLSAQHEIYSYKNDSLREIFSVEAPSEVLTFYKSDKEKLLVGCRDGLYEINLRTQKNRNLARNIEVRYICSYKNFNWLFSYGQGIYLMNDHTKRKLPIDENGSLNYAHYMFLSSDSSLWIPTNSGLIRILPEDASEMLANEKFSPNYIRYDEADGIENLEFNGCGNPSFDHDKMGNFYLANMGGIVVFHPDSIPIDKRIGDIILCGLRVNNAPHTLSDTVYTTPSDTTLDVIIRASGFYNRYTRLEYKLNDSIEWRELPLRLHLTLDNLPKGEIRLQIRNRISGKLFKSKLIIILRKEYWYQNRVLQGSLAFLLTLAFVNITVNNMQRYRQRKKLEEERQAMINRILLHDIKSPMNYLKHIITHLSSSADQYQNENQELLQVLDKTTSDIITISDTLLNWAKAKQNNLSERVNLAAEISTSIDYYREILESKGIYINNKIGYTPARINPVIFQIILNNLFDNVAKHGQAGPLTIEVIQSCTHARFRCIKITNQGVIASNKLKNIQDLFAGKPSEYMSLYKTLGTTIIADLCKLQSYIVNIDSIPTDNTTMVEIHLIEK